MEPSDSLLISSGVGHNQTVGISSSQIPQVLSAFLPPRGRSRLSSAQEAMAVFSRQPVDSLPNFNLRVGNMSSTLPGSCPLIDHLRAYVSARPDWDTYLGPLLTDMAATRLKSPCEAKELTLGMSPDSDWEAATAFIKRMSRSDREKGVLFVAADTEGYQVEVDWHSGYKGLTAILSRIQEAKEVKQDSISFNSGFSSKSAASFPVRFFVGGADWAVHVKLPVQNVTVNGKPRLLLDLSTKLTPAMREWFKALPCMVGCGVMDDYLSFSKITTALWLDTFFNHVPLPIEIGDLLHLAGVAMPQSSMFVTNWWCFGTLLPKDQGSRGDNLWASDMEDLPKGLARYLVCDTRLPAIAASILAIIWAIHHFPDAYWVNVVSGMTPLSFVEWVASHVMTRLLPNIRPVEYLGESGPMRSYEHAQQLRAPELISSYGKLLLQLGLPRGAEWEILRQDPGWPAITAGGPCYIHSARAYMNSLLPILRTIDPATWALGQVDQLVLYQFGITSELYSYPLQASTNTGPWEVDPGVVNPLMADFKALTKEALREHITVTVRGSRAMFLEYVRLYPWSGRDMLLYFEEHTKHFKQLVGETRFRLVVLDIRRCLTFMGLMPARHPQWRDPFFVDNYIKKVKANAAKTLKRRRDQLSSGLLSNTSQLAAVEQALALAEDPASGDVGQLPAFRCWNEPQGLLRPPGISNAAKARRVMESLVLQSSSCQETPQEVLSTVWVPESPPRRRQRPNQPIDSLEEDIEIFIDQGEMEMFGPS
jgi:hypothetical protein